jgi:hypothetical protein
VFGKYGTASVTVLSIKEFLFAMELSVMLASKELPATSTDDSVRPNDIVSMQFSTPASITIRRPMRSHKVDLVEKKKHLNFHVSVFEGISDLLVYFPDLDTKPILPNVDLPVIPYVSPNLVEIADPSFVVCPFDLGISIELCRSGPNVKLVISDKIDPPMVGPLDDLSDAAFDEFVSSLPDCMLCDSDNDSASKNETIDPESKPGNIEAS